MGFAERGMAGAAGRVLSRILLSAGAGLLLFGPAGFADSSSDASSSASPGSDGGSGSSSSGSDSLKKAQEVLKAGGFDLNKHMKVKDDGSVQVSGSYAVSALRKAGIDLSKVNVKDSLPAFSKSEVGAKAKEILKSRGMNPDEYIGADGSQIKGNSYASSALQAAQASLRLGAFGPATLKPPSDPSPRPPMGGPVERPGFYDSIRDKYGSGESSVADAGGSSIADEMKRARETLLSKGFDPNQVLSIKSDGSVQVGGSYANSALRAAGIDLTKINLNGSMPTPSDRAVASAARESLQARGMDPDRYVSVGPDGSVQVNGSYGSSAMEQAKQRLILSSFGASVPKGPGSPSSGGVATPPASTDPGTLPPAIVPPVAPPPPDVVVQPVEPGPIVPPYGLKLDVSDKAARSLVEKANSLNRSDNETAAAGVYQQAIEQAKKSGDLQAAAWAMVGLGTAQRHMKDRDTAEKTYGEANLLLQFMRGSDDSTKKKDADRLLAISEHGLGAVNLVRGDYGSALNHYKLSADYYREGGFNALVTLSGDAFRIDEMSGKLRASGKAIPKYSGLPDAKDYIASVLGKPKPGPTPPPPGTVPPPPTTDPGSVASGAPAGIYGFGVTKGGEGQKVFTVTSLSDTGGGSLRDAIQKAQANGGGMIKFAVEGDIRLKSGLEIRAPNLTIDGFSAPGKGITIRGGGNGQYDISVVTHDVILRNLAVRNGYDLVRIQPDQKGDMNQVHHIVLDHMSLTNSGDGAVDITRGAHDITVQWSLIAGAGTQDGGASLVKYGTTNVTFHHNLWDINHRRNMLANDAFVDYRNNVVKNWTQWGTRWESGASGNAVNNTFIQEPGGGLSDAGPKALYTYQGPGQVYFSGNEFKGIAKMGPGPTSSKALSVPYSIPTEGAAESAEKVFKYAGKGNGNRDDVDQKYLSLKTWDQAKAYGG